MIIENLFFGRKKDGRGRVGELTWYWSGYWPARWVTRNPPWEPPIRNTWVKSKVRNISRYRKLWIRIRRIHMFLGLPDQDPIVRDPEKL
jgi:hypothetical protein